MDTGEDLTADFCSSSVATMKMQNDSLKKRKDENYFFLFIISMLVGEIKSHEKKSIDVCSKISAIYTKATRN